ncbi:MAG: transcription antitermination factor NusB [Eggerthellaceae bacterium]|nr:transcription antitermination factor NusB [Eggerthellaceae bacterium]
MGERANKRSFTQGGRGDGRGRGGYGGRGGGARGGNQRGKGASPARMAALETVRTLRERDAFAQEVMARTVDQARLTPEDRAFATRLVLGVVSTRGTLNEVLDRCMRSPHDVNDDVRDALQISAYEIIFLDKSPHAAVDQGVELVRSVAPRAGGVANAVLRKVVSAKRAFPFGDPSTDIEAYARLHGFPLWLVKRLIADMGATEAHNLVKTSNEPAPVYVAVNACAARDSEVVEVLADAHGEPKPVEVDGAPVEGCYRIADGRVLLDGRVKRLINNGCLLVSDAASQAVAALALPHARPASFLEIGAGRGTKTILLQSNACRRWGAQVDDYVALDNRGFKTSLLTDRARDYGVQLASAVTGDAAHLDEAIGERAFDAVFIDAPCSGLGTLRRHPEIRWRLRPETITEHADLGFQMLESASAHVAPGGMLAFATCTVLPEENAHAVARFLKSPAGASFELVPVNGKAAFATQVTSGGNDAHFCAILRSVRC